MEIADASRWMECLAVCARKDRKHQQMEEEGGSDGSGGGMLVAMAGGWQKILRDEENEPESYREREGEKAGRKGC